MSRKIKSEFKKYVATAIIAAFGFLIALAWRDLITKLVENFTKTELLETYPYIAELYSTIIVTVIGVLAIFLISKWVQSSESN
ncbi:hypothetical protein CXT76_00715 [Candidatus Parvarchaeota archaeon]|jgi:hypothetical protein|nr:MAG: hypothetical protein CXT76_00715 [Candidatus Parvarchaeota archaeon]HIG52342.1 hypothetical protein [Candidatus Pacearchaeota archaeon]